MTLNERAFHIVERMRANAARMRIGYDLVAGARVYDCGVNTIGGLDAGLHLARVSQADLAEVQLVAMPEGPAVQVATDDPVRACLACQYAGRQIAVGKFFGMGSGPMRAVIDGEAIFDHIAGREESHYAVGVIESRKLPTEEVIESIRAKLPACVQELDLLIAPASSMAGNIQVVARSVETAMHKLHELKFDVNQVLSGFGTAPMPPVTPQEIAAIGRTNDAILYGARVTLVVDCDDAILDAIGPQVPSSSSKDHGSLFAELFTRYGDFYKIDPMLFSPAEITFHNRRTGSCKTFGKVEPDLLRKSFYGA
jgi:methenyltetrahydromethanopterin cyclohydrolase